MYHVTVFSAGDLQQRIWNKLGNNLVFLVKVGIMADRLISLAVLIKFCLSIESYDNHVTKYLRAKITSLAKKCE